MRQNGNGQEGMGVEVMPVPQRMAFSSIWISCTRSEDGRLQASHNMEGLISAQRIRERLGHDAQGPRRTLILYLGTLEPAEKDQLLDAEVPLASTWYSYLHANGRSSGCIERDPEILVKVGMK